MRQPLPPLRNLPPRLRRRPRPRLRALTLRSVRRPLLLLRRPRERIRLIRRLLRGHHRPTLVGHRLQIGLELRAALLTRRVDLCLERRDIRLPMEHAAATLAVST